MVMAQGIFENTIKQIYNVDYTKQYMYTTKTCIYKYQNGDRKKNMDGNQGRLVKYTILNTTKLM